MAINFEKEKIKNIELKTGVPVAGFFSPNDELIYCRGTHYSWANPVSLIFLKYITFVITNETKDNEFSLILQKNNEEKYKEMIKDDLDELIFRGYVSYYSYKTKPFNEFYEEIIKEKELYEEIIEKDHSTLYDKFSLDLLNFFEKAYINGDYINSIQKITRVDNEKTIRKKIIEEYNLTENDKYTCDKYVEKKIKKELLSTFKDICIQYVGYDALERFMPSGRKIDIPVNEEYDKFFYNTPRVITTSDSDIYERFYNYLLMDWEIYKVPKYIFNNETNMYELEDETLNTFRQEKNEEIKDEIQSIKKLVPPNERNKFFKR